MHYNCPRMKKSPLEAPVSVRFSPQARREIRRVSKQIETNESETIRKAARLGLPILLSLLGRKAPAKNLPV